MQARISDHSSLNVPPLHTMLARTGATSMYVLLLGCLAGCAAGSCLSYGHSCWGAHGKRSSGDIQDSRWFISRLAPITTRLQHQSESAQWFARPPQDSEDEQRKQQQALGETSVLIPAEADEESTDERDREVIVMEQPPRIYKILNHPPNKLDFKTPTKK